MVNNMEAVLFLKNKLLRHVKWNGQPIIFYRNSKNEYNELTDEIENQFIIIGLFHEGGGYGGMLNIELYERDGARTFSKMKPMILCSYQDGFNLKTDDWCKINNNTYKIVEKNDVKNLGIAFEISLEIDNG